jgi:hypothetical protein
MSCLTWKNYKNRPSELDKFVVYYDTKYLKEKKIHLLFDNKDYLTFIIKHNRPLVSLSYERDGSRYPYIVSIDLLEGFKHSRWELTEKGIEYLKSLRQDFRNVMDRKSVNRDILSTFNYWSLKNKEEAIKMCNFLANIDSHYFIDSSSTPTAADYSGLSILQL